MRSGRLIGASIAAVACIIIAILLGNWQMRRGDVKLALQAQADAAEQAAPGNIVPSLSSIEQTAAALPRRVHASGVFDDAGTIYLDNRALNGMAGVYVLTPLVIGQQLPALLIDRGWKQRDLQDRSRVNVPPPPPGVVTVEGLAVARPSSLLELGRDAELRVPGLWQNLDYEAYERVTGRRVARFVIRQSADARVKTPDGLQREWAQLGSGVEKHRGYAFQWYSIAALIAVLALALGIKRKRNR